MLNVARLSHRWFPAVSDISQNLVEYCLYLRYTGVCNYNASRRLDYEI